MTHLEITALIAIAERKIRRAAFDEAVTILTAATELNPEHTGAWHMLADIHRRKNRSSAAISCYRRGIQASPDQIDLFIGLANALSDAGRFSEALASFQAALEYDPENSDYLFGCAHAMHRAGLTGDAIAVLDRIISGVSEAPLPRFSRATMMLTLGRYREGWRDYDGRHLLNTTFHPPDLPLWDGTPAPNKRLLVVPDGGYGDIVWATRFLGAIQQIFAGLHIVLPPALRELLRNVHGVDEFCSDSASSGCDLYCPILSLPVRLDVTKPTDYPPARLKPASPATYCPDQLIARAGERLRVGIIWSGNERYSENRHRAAPLDVFLPLLERPHVQLFSLQKGRQQIELHKAGLSDLIIETNDSDFSETAALLEALDLVIMTDSAVAHISGSLRVPIWVLLDFTPFWLFGREGAQTPWYPNMRLFRQKQPGDWVGVMTEVGDALDAITER